MFSQLREQHRLILLTASAMIELVGRPAAAAAGELASTRTRLAQQLSEHLKSEEEQLHAPLRAKRQSAAIPHYERVALATRDLRLSYSAHIAKWRPADIATQWSDYGSEVRGLLARLRSVIEQEEAFLYPAAQALLSRHEGDRTV